MMDQSPAVNAALVLNFVLSRRRTAMVVSTMKAEVMRRVVSPLALSAIILARLYWR